MKKLFLLFTFVLLFMGTNIAQNYVGSTVCMGCHNNVNPNTGYNIWEEYMTSGHPYKLNPVSGAPPVYPPNTSPGVPDPPPGTVWSDYQYVIGGYGWKARFVLPTGRVFTATEEVQYNLEDSSWVAYHFGEDKKYNYGCFQCHTTGPSPEGSWNGVPDDSLGTFNEPGIRCEGCHGPGSDHVSNPTTHPPIQGDDLKLNRCGECHQRGGATNNIPASGGYIRHHEQINEFRASRHGDGNNPDLTCASCHEAHVPLRYPDATPEEGLSATCQTCHNPADYPVLVNGVQKSIDCVDCHMPPASKSAIGLVVGNGRRGDVKTHLMAINVNPVDYNAMFTGDGSAVLLDGDGLGAVTLDFTCLRCHTSETVAWAAPFADNIHTEGIVTDVNDNSQVPTVFSLEQNYPNPFNPSTTVEFSIPQSSQVLLSLYTITGELVENLMSEFMPAGNHKINFNASGLPSGVYLYKINAGEFSSAKKMILMK
jgi:hypothetical protein